MTRYEFLMIKLTATAEEIQDHLNKKAEEGWRVSSHSAAVIKTTDLLGSDMTGGAFTFVLEKEE